tara:strand:- start:484 stop:777 length:294 start_codon:yes stop_codon:yes gene_type:complete
MVSMVVKKSDKQGKKYVAVFTRDNGRIKRTYFGQAGADDYLKTKNKEQRARYRSRHTKDLNTKDYTRAGYLSWYLLWGNSTSLRANISSYKSKFNLK